MATICPVRRLWPHRQDTAYVEPLEIAGTSGTARALSFIRKGDTGFRNAQGAAR